MAIDEAKTLEGSPEDIQCAVDFIDLHTAEWQLMSDPGIAFQEPRILSDGRVMSAEFWRYATEDLQPGGKCDIDTPASALSNAVLNRLATKLLQAGEIHIITGSSDDTLSMRIFLKNRSLQNSSLESAVPVNLVKEGIQSALLRE